MWTLKCHAIGVLQLQKYLCWLYFASRWGSQVMHKVCTFFFFGLVPTKLVTYTVLNYIYFLLL